MKKPRRRKDTEVSDFDRGKTTPPRPLIFTYSILGDRYTLRGQPRIVAAAERAYKKVYGDL